MNTRHRVYAYITHGGRLLLFRQPESPSAGIQVPGGTLMEGEDPAVAALRESREETGLSAFSVARFLGDDIRDMRDCGKQEYQHRWFFHISCDETPPDEWSHGECDISGRLLHRFDFFWAKLPDEVPTLIANFGDKIPQLVEGMKTEPNQSMQTTPRSVTCCACAQHAPARSVSDLGRWAI